jgi:ribosomal subunit interface protein
MENIKINAIGLELDKETKAYLMKKLESLKKFIDFDDEEVTANIRLNKETRSQHSGNLYRAEISIMTIGKKYGAKGEGGELLTAIDDMKDVILKKISSHKGKKQSLFRKGAVKIKQLLKREGGVKN